MKAVGIICEYNPYHGGHARQLAAAKAVTEGTAVISVMSEHLTQRGELAVADSYTRAGAAMACGADLVVGLPYPYSAAPADYFATAGVRILNALGASALHFGSECGDIALLQDAAAALYSPEFTTALAARQTARPAEGVMESRAAVWQQLYGTPLPGGSNDLLALAYLRALAATDSPMTPYTLRREGQAYNDATAPREYTLPSASAIRALWQKEGLAAIAPHLPAPVYEALIEACRAGLAPLREAAIGPALLAFWRTADPEALSGCAGLEGGVAERLCGAARDATDLAGLLSLAATRRYTTARLRRALYAGFCGVTLHDLVAPPAYVRLLAANRRGCAYLAAIRKTCPLPIVTKPADLPATPAAARQRAIEERLEALVTLAYPTPQPAGALTRRGPVIEK